MLHRSLGKTCPNCRSAPRKTPEPEQTYADLVAREGLEGAQAAGAAEAAKTMVVAPLGEHAPQPQQKIIEMKWLNPFIFTLEEQAVKAFAAKPDVKHYIDSFSEVVRQQEEKLKKDQEGRTSTKISETVSEAAMELYSVTFAHKNIKRLPDTNLKAEVKLQAAMTPSISVCCIQMTCELWNRTGIRCLPVSVSEWGGERR